MRKWKKFIKPFLMLSVALILVLGSFYIYVQLSTNTSAKGVTFELSRFSSPTSEAKQRSQLQYENAWSEQIELENTVRPFENYIINWVSTYAGKTGFQGQNTTSLKYTKLENKGSYTNMVDLVKAYPNLLGVIEKVSVEYSYDSVSDYLVQQVQVYKRGVSGYRQVLVTYDKTGSVVDYMIGNFTKIGGSSEED